MSKKANLIFNGTLILIATAIGATFPKVGSILGYVGGFVGLGLIYIIPIAVYLKRYKMKLEDPMLVKALDENRLKTLENYDGSMSSPKLVVADSSPQRGLLNKSQDTKSQDDISAYESLLNNKQQAVKVSYGKFYLL